MAARQPAARPLVLLGLLLGGAGVACGEYALIPGEESLYSKTMWPLPEDLAAGHELRLRIGSGAATVKLDVTSPNITLEMRMYAYVEDYGPLCDDYIANEQPLQTRTNYSLAPADYQTADADTKSVEEGYLTFALEPREVMFCFQHSNEGDNNFPGTVDVVNSVTVLTWYLFYRTDAGSGTDRQWVFKPGQTGKTLVYNPHPYRRRQQTVLRLISSESADWNFTTGGDDCIANGGCREVDAIKLVPRRAPCTIDVQNFTVARAQGIGYAGAVGNATYPSLVTDDGSWNTSTYVCDNAIAAGCTVVLSPAFVEGGFDPYTNRTSPVENSTGTAYALVTMPDTPGEYEVCFSAVQYRKWVRTGIQERLANNATLDGTEAGGGFDGLPVWRKLQSCVENCDAGTPTPASTTSPIHITVQEETLQWSMQDLKAGSFGPLRVDDTEGAGLNLAPHVRGMVNADGGGAVRLVPAASFQDYTDTDALYPTAVGCYAERDNNDALASLEAPTAALIGTDDLVALPVYHPNADASLADVDAPAVTVGYAQAVAVPATTATELYVCYRQGGMWGWRVLPPRTAPAAGGVANDTWVPVPGYTEALALRAGAYGATHAPADTATWSISDVRDGTWGPLVAHHPANATVAGGPWRPPTAATDAVHTAVHVIPANRPCDWNHIHAAATARTAALPARAGQVECYSKFAETSAFCLGKFNTDVAASHAFYMYMPQAAASPYRVCLRYGAGNFMQVAMKDAGGQLDLTVAGAPTLTMTLTESEEAVETLAVFNDTQGELAVGMRYDDAGEVADYPLRAPGYTTNNSLCVGIDTSVAAAVRGCVATGDVMTVVAPGQECDRWYGLADYIAKDDYLSMFCGGGPWWEDAACTAAMHADVFSPWLGAVLRTRQREDRIVVRDVAARTSLNDTAAALTLPAAGTYTVCYKQAARANWVLFNLTTTGVTRSVEVFPAPSDDAPLVAGSTQRFTIKDPAMTPVSEYTHTAWYPDADVTLQAGGYVTTPDGDGKLLSISASVKDPRARVQLVGGGGNGTVWEGSVAQVALARNPAGNGIDVLATGVPAGTAVKFVLASPNGNRALKDNYANRGCLDAPASTEGQPFASFTTHLTTSETTDAYAFYLSVPTAHGAYTMCLWTPAVRSWRPLGIYHVQDNGVRYALSHAPVNQGVVTLSFRKCRFDPATGACVGNDEVFNTVPGADAAKVVPYAKDCEASDPAGRGDEVGRSWHIDGAAVGDLAPNDGVSTQADITVRFPRVAEDASKRYKVCIATEVKVYAVGQQGNASALASRTRRWVEAVQDPDALNSRFYNDVSGLVPSRGRDGGAAEAEAMEGTSCMDRPGLCSLASGVRRWILQTNMLQSEAVRKEDRATGTVSALSAAEFATDAAANAVRDAPARYYPTSFISVATQYPDYSFAAGRVTSVYGLTFELFTRIISVPAPAAAPVAPGFTVGDVHVKFVPRGVGVTCLSRGVVGAPVAAAETLIANDAARPGLGVATDLPSETGGYLICARLMRAGDADASAYPWLELEGGTSLQDGQRGLWLVAHSLSFRAQPNAVRIYDANSINGAAAPSWCDGPTGTPAFATVSCAGNALAHDYVRVVEDALRCPVPEPDTVNATGWVVLHPKTNVTTAPEDATAFKLPPTEASEVSPTGKYKICVYKSAEAEAGVGSVGEFVRRGLVFAVLNRGDLLTGGGTFHYAETVVLDALKVATDLVYNASRHFVVFDDTAATAYDAVEPKPAMATPAVATTREVGFTLTPTGGGREGGAGGGYPVWVELCPRALRVDQLACHKTIPVPLGAGGGTSVALGGTAGDRDMTTPAPFDIAGVGGGCAAGASETYGWNEMGLTQTFPAGGVAAFPVQLRSLCASDGDEGDDTAVVGDTVHAGCGFRFLAAPPRLAASAPLVIRSPPIWLNVARNAPVGLAVNGIPLEHIADPAQQSVCEGTRTTCPLLDCAAGAPCPLTLRARAERSTEYAPYGNVSVSYSPAHPQPDAASGLTFEPGAAEGPSRPWARDGSYLHTFTPRLSSAVGSSVVVYFQATVVWNETTAGGGQSVGTLVSRFAVRIAPRTAAGVDVLSIDEVAVEAVGRDVAQTMIGAAVPGAPRWAADDAAARMTAVDGSYLQALHPYAVVFAVRDNTGAAMSLEALRNWTAGIEVTASADLLLESEAPPAGFPPPLLDVRPVGRRGETARNVTLASAMNMATSEATPLSADALQPVADPAVLAALYPRHPYVRAAVDADPGAHVVFTLPFRILHNIGCSRYGTAQAGCVFTVRLRDTASAREATGTFASPVRVPAADLAVTRDGATGAAAVVAQGAMAPLSKGIALRVLPGTTDAARGLFYPDEYYGGTIFACLGHGAEPDDLLLVDDAAVGTRNADRISGRPAAASVMKAAPARLASPSGNPRAHDEYGAVLRLRSDRVCVGCGVAVASSWGLAYPDPLRVSFVDDSVRLLCALPAGDGAITWPGGYNASNEFTVAAQVAADDLTQVPLGGWAVTATAVGLPAGYTLDTTRAATAIDADGTVLLTSLTLTRGAGAGTALPTTARVRLTAARPDYDAAQAGSVALGTTTSLSCDATLDVAPANTPASVFARGYDQAEITATWVSGGTAICDTPDATCLDRVFQTTDARAVVDVAVAKPADWAATNLQVFIPEIDGRWGAFKTLASRYPDIAGDGGAVYTFGKLNVNFTREEQSPDPAKAPWERTRIAINLDTYTKEDAAGTFTDPVREASFRMCFTTPLASQGPTCKTIRIWIVPAPTHATAEIARIVSTTGLASTVLTPGYGGSGAAACSTLFNASASTVRVTAAVAYAWTSPRDGGATRQYVVYDRALRYRLTHTPSRTPLVDVTRWERDGNVTLSPVLYRENELAADSAAAAADASLRTRLLASGTRMVEYTFSGARVPTAGQRGVFEVQVIDIDPTGRGAVSVPAAYARTATEHEFSVPAPTPYVGWVLRERVEEDVVCPSRRALARASRGYGGYEEASPARGRGHTSAVVGEPVPLQTVLLAAGGADSDVLRAWGSPTMRVSITKHSSTGCNDGGELRLYNLRDNPSSASSRLELDGFLATSFEPVSHGTLVDGASLTFVTFSAPCEACVLELALCYKGASGADDCLGASGDLDAVNPDDPDGPPFHTRIVRTRPINVRPVRASGVMITKQALPPAAAAGTPLRVGEEFTVDFAATQVIDGAELAVVAGVDAVLLAAWEPDPSDNIATVRYGFGGPVALSATPGAAQACQAAAQTRASAHPVVRAADGRGTVTFHFTRPCSRCAVYLIAGFGGSRVAVPLRAAVAAGVHLGMRVTACATGFGLLSRQRVVTHTRKMFAISVARVDAEGLVAWEGDPYRSTSAAGSEEALAWTGFTEGAAARGAFQSAGGAKAVAATWSADPALLEFITGANGGGGRVTHRAGTAGDATATLLVVYDTACYGCKVVAMGSGVDVYVTTTPTRAVALNVTAEANATDAYSMTFYLADENGDRALAPDFPAYLALQRPYEQGVLDGGGAVAVAAAEAGGSVLCIMQTDPGKPLAEPLRADASKFGALSAVAINVTAGSPAVAFEGRVYHGVALGATTAGVGRVGLAWSGVAPVDPVMRLEVRRGAATTTLPLEHRDGEPVTLAAGVNATHLAVHAVGSAGAAAAGLRVLPFHDIRIEVYPMAVDTTRTSGDTTRTAVVARLDGDIRAQYTCAPEVCGADGAACVLPETAPITNAARPRGPHGGHVPVGPHAAFNVRLNSNAPGGSCKVTFTSTRNPTLVMATSMTLEQPTQLAWQWVTRELVPSAAAVAFPAPAVPTGTATNVATQAAAIPANTVTAMAVRAYGAAAGGVVSGAAVTAIDWAATIGGWAALTVTSTPEGCFTPIGFAAAAPNSPEVVLYGVARGSDTTAAVTACSVDVEGFPRADTVEGLVYVNNTGSEISIRYPLDLSVHHVATVALVLDDASSAAGVERVVVGRPFRLAVKALSATGGVVEADSASTAIITGVAYDEATGAPAEGVASMRFARVLERGTVVVEMTIDAAPPPGVVYRFNARVALGGWASGEADDPSRLPASLAGVDLVEFNSVPKRVVDTPTVTARVVVDVARLSIECSRPQGMNEDAYATEEMQDAPALPAVIGFPMMVTLRALQADGAPAVGAAMQVIVSPDGVPCREAEAQLYANSLKAAADGASTPAATGAAFQLGLSTLTTICTRGGTCSATTVPQCVPFADKAARWGYAALQSAGAIADRDAAVGAFTAANGVAVLEKVMYRRKASQYTRGAEIAALKFAARVEDHTFEITRRFSFQAIDRLKVGGAVCEAVAVGVCILQANDAFLNVTAERTAEDPDSAILDYLRVEPFEQFSWEIVVVDDAGADVAGLSTGEVSVGATCDDPLLSTYDTKFFFGAMNSEGLVDNDLPRWNVAPIVAGKAVFTNLAFAGRCSRVRVAIGVAAPISADVTRVLRDLKYVTNFFEVGSTSVAPSPPPPTVTPYPAITLNVGNQKLADINYAQVEEDMTAGVLERLAAEALDVSGGLDVHVAYACRVSAGSVTSQEISEALKADPTVCTQRPYDGAGVVVAPARGAAPLGSCFDGCETLLEVWLVLAPPSNGTVWSRDEEIRGSQLLLQAADAASTEDLMVSVVAVSAPTPPPAPGTTYAPATALPLFHRTPVPQRPTATPLVLAGAAAVPQHLLLLVATLLACVQHLLA